jgi:hypothetical protein
MQAEQARLEKSGEANVGEDAFSGVGAGTGGASFFASPLLPPSPQIGEMAFSIRPFLRPLSTIAEFIFLSQLPPPPPLLTTPTPTAAPGRPPTRGPPPALPPSRSPSSPNPLLPSPPAGVRRSVRHRKRYRRPRCLLAELERR